MLLKGDIKSDKAIFGIPSAFLLCCLNVKNLFNTAPKRGCEWPEGHPDEADFRFCGKDRFEDKPYCLDHCAVAYVVPEKEENEKTELNNTI